MSEAPAAGDRVLEALTKLPLCSQLDDRNRRKLAKLCTLKTFEAGDVIFEEGTLGLGLFIVTSGRVQTYKTSGDERIDLGAVDAGGVLGQTALLDDQPRAASAVAVEPTDCLMLTRDSLDTLVKKDPQIAWCLTPGLAERIRELQQLAMDAKLAQESRGPGAAADEPKAKAKSAEAEQDETDEDEEDEEPSEFESALFKMMRMQYGLMAGTAKGVTDMAKVMETFLDSMAEETDFKNNEDWRDLLEKIPDAMVTATRSALDEGGKVPEDMVDAYRRYSDGKD